MTLPEFMAACLAEDQQKAEKLLRFAQETRLRLSDIRFLGKELPGWWAWPDVEAMCGRVLEDVAAKRAVLDLHPVPCMSCLVGVPDEVEYGVLPCPTLLYLAQSFKGRDGWQTAWEVEG